MLAFCTSCATASSLRYLLSSRCNASGKPSRSSEKLSAAVTDTGEPWYSLYFLQLSALWPQPAAYLPSDSSTAHLQQGPVPQSSCTDKGFTLQSIWDPQPKHAWAARDASLWSNAPRSSCSLCSTASPPALTAITYVVLWRWRAGWRTFKWVVFYPTSAYYQCLRRPRLATGWENRERSGCSSPLL